MNNFEEIVFGKLPSISGFSQKELPANLLYLAWDLHDGYNKTGTQKALELHQKWLNCWLHLPLSICHLGGKYGREFARSFAHIILGTPLLSAPSLRELCYMKFLELDIAECGDEYNDFGLSVALRDQIFHYEYFQFIQEQKPLNQLPKIFEFVKNRIWYIVVHQQQIEGLFNKWDLKTHPNMTSNLQQSKLRLTSMPLTEIGCNSLDLMELQVKKRQKQINERSLTQENLEDNERERKANVLFDNLFGK
ncbi:hypothetical protein C1645_743915 [Glomus cerebriforme]|uniref:Uncharacterized protein n=1 Tax=Glomus cerebriforme TaxID=658196 RepID=A0A397SHJ4_9GLOM|nr:hypothetical protein C1645_743915 [Glomus cerebriforme]